jgi:MarR family transcriptional regulator, transcriptional regulator for hemolysin
LAIYNKFFHQYLQVSRTFTKKLNERLAKINMYHSQWSVIYYLNISKTATLVEISNYFDVEKPTITRTVNRLEELGVIEQIPGKDKRERRIQLTDLGVQKYIEGQKIVDEFEQSVMKDITEADREQARRTLLTLQKNLKGD